MQKQLQFFSVASDGRVTLWTLEKSELTHQVDGWLSQQMQSLVQHMDMPVEAAEMQAHLPCHRFSSSVQQVLLDLGINCMPVLLEEGLLHAHQGGVEGPDLCRALSASARTRHRLVATAQHSCARLP